MADAAEQSRQQRPLLQQLATCCHSQGIQRLLTDLANARDLLMKEGSGGQKAKQAAQAKVGVGPST